MRRDSTNSRTTQRDRTLALLIDARGDWVPAPELARVGGLQFQTPIYEIRHKLGLKVENRKEHHSGQTHSWYRLTSSPAPSAPQSKPEPGRPGTLFDILPPDRSYRE